MATLEPSRKSDQQLPIFFSGDIAAVPTSFPSRTKICLNLDTDYDKEQILE